MSFKNQSTEETVYTLNIPELDGKEGYVAAFFQRFKEIGSILSSADFFREPIRINMMCELIIAQIPQEKRRKEVRAKAVEIYDELKKERIKELGRQLKDIELSECLLLSSIRAMGFVTDYVEKFIGLSEENKIGFVKAP
jgi:hypothetical protein